VIVYSMGGERAFIMLPSGRQAALILLTED
jgi:hypothetical protein